MGDMAENVYLDDQVLAFLKAGRGYPTTPEDIKRVRGMWGALSVEKLNKEFGDMLCKPCIVAGFGAKRTLHGKEYMRYCKSCEAAGHGQNGAAHKVEEARKRWGGFSKEVRDSFRCAR